jgi:hypothetical protein
LRRDRARDRERRGTACARAAALLVLVLVMLLLLLLLLLPLLPPLLLLLPLLLVVVGAESYWAWWAAPRPVARRESPRLGEAARALGRAELNVRGCFGGMIYSIQWRGERKPCGDARASCGGRGLRRRRGLRWRLGLRWRRAASREDQRACKGGGRTEGQERERARTEGQERALTEGEEIFERDRGGRGGTASDG